MNIKPILLRILGWAVFFSFFLLIFPPFKGGKSGGTNGEGRPGPESYVEPAPAEPVVKRQSDAAVKQSKRDRFKAKPQIKPASRAFVKVPPKAIVVPEDPVPSAVLKKKSSSQSAYPKRTYEQLKVKVPPAPLKAVPRYYRLKKSLHGKVVHLRRWASPRAFWGSRINDYEDLILISQRWHYGTGTLWIKVTRKNGQSGWLPYGYLNN